MNDESSVQLMGDGGGERAAVEPTVLNCDREPIHVPGLIQPHGALLAYDPITGRISHASQNLHDFLASDDLPAVGRRVEDLLGSAGRAGLESALNSRTGGPVRHQIVELPARPEHGQPLALEAVVHLHRGVCVAELQYGVSGAATNDWMQPFAETIDALRAAPDLDTLVERVAQYVKRLIGFDRVMVYQFEEDWHGHVLADAREAELPSFHDLHYPAADIPAQARELYRTNLVRYIPDVDYRPVLLSPDGVSRQGHPLDLSHATLRSVSPMHIQYLRNMDVRSTLTMSLLVGGRLWGLVACHHRVPTALPIRLRRACYALAINIGFMVDAHENHHRAVSSESTRLAHGRILDCFSQHELSLERVIEQCSADLLHICSATGGVFWRGDTTIGFGSWPAEQRVGTVMRHLREHFESSRDDFLCTDGLITNPPLLPVDVRQVCGAIAIALDTHGQAGLALIRPEFRREVGWGGDPDKTGPIEIGADGRVLISPRNSFSRWEVLVSGRSRPWSEVDRSAVQGLQGLRQVLAVRDSLNQVTLSDRQFRSLVALQSDAYWQIDARWRVVALSRPLPATDGQVEGRSLLSLFAPHCDPRQTEELRQALLARTPFRGLRIRSRTNTPPFELLINGEPIRDINGLLAGWHGSVTDVTPDLVLRDALVQREREQRAMLDNELVGIFRVRDDHVVWTNLAIERMLGYPPAALCGHSLQSLCADEAASATLQTACAMMTGEMGVRIQLYLRRQDGLRRWVDLSSVLVNARARESLWLAADITPLRESQALATHIELHDPLTALPNRALLTDRLRAALQNCRRHADALAVCHLDIDDFTRINERLGIAAGDQLLREVARRLGRTVREGDTVSRIHGNAFILLLTGVDQGTSVRSALDRVVQVLGAPVALQGANGAGEEILLTATIGVALFPDGGTDAESLFDSADRAMYLGKQEGRNRIRMLQ